MRWNSAVRSWLSVLILVGAFAAKSGSAAPSPRYSLIDLGTLGGPSQRGRSVAVRRCRIRLSRDPRRSERSVDVLNVRRIEVPARRRRLALRPRSGGSSEAHSLCRYAVCRLSA